MSGDVIPLRPRDQVPHRLQLRIDPNVNPIWLTGKLAELGLVFRHDNSTHTWWLKPIAIARIEDSQQGD